MKYYEQECISISLYKKFGIAEWQEKSQILKEAEVEYILKHLDEEDNVFVKLVQLPFPKFAEVYFKQFKDKLPYVENPQFGYNLFLLNEGQINVLMKYLRETDKNSKKIVSKVTEILEELVIPFDSSLKINKRNPRFKKHVFQKAYISQYINKEEAKRLQFTHRTFYEYGEYKDFNLQDKINCLNGVTREIFNCFLGMEGRQRLDIKGVTQKLDAVEANVKVIADIAALPISKTVKEFKNAIGYQESDEKGFHVYTNPIFKKIDFYINYFYYMNHIISPSDAIILNSLDYKTTQIYIASKYFYSSPSSVRKVLEVNQEDAKTFENYMVDSKKQKK